MIRATYQLVNVDDVFATMTLTMSIKEWRELRAKMPQEWPAWEFGSRISEMIRHAEKQFSERQDSPP